VNTVGVILLAVGICSVVIGGAMFALGANRRITTRESVKNTPSGSERLVEQHNVMTYFRARDRKAGNGICSEGLFNSDGRLVHSRSANQQTAHDAKKSYELQRQQAGQALARPRAAEKPPNVVSVSSDISKLFGGNRRHGTGHREATSKRLCVVSVRSRPWHEPARTGRGCHR
jgi:K+-transporting ATPase c subunit